MKPEDRYDWIERFIKDDPAGAVDVVNRDFVDAYVEDTKATASFPSYGAPICRQLGRDLSEMKRRGRLKRARIGLTGMGGMGFPRWVWSYRLRRGYE